MLSHWGRGSSSISEAANAGQLSAFPPSCRSLWGNAHVQLFLVFCLWTHQKWAAYRGQVRPHWNPLDSQGTLDPSFNLGEPQNAQNGGEHTQWKGYTPNAAVQIKMRCVCIMHGLPDTHLIHFTYLPALAHSKAHTELQISYQRPKQTAWDCTAISFSPLLVSPPTHILIISYQL